jgi:hypothetical protein
MVSSISNLFILSRKYDFGNNWSYETKSLPQWVQDFDEKKVLEKLPKLQSNANLYLEKNV